MVCRHFFTCESYEQTVKWEVKEVKGSYRASRWKLKGQYNPSKYICLTSNTIHL